MLVAKQFSLPLDLTGIADCRVLIVEDDYFLAAELVALLSESGATVMGPVSTIPDARRLASEQTPDCVLLDVHLHGEHSFELAEEFREQGIPMIFTTGYDNDDLPENLQDASCLSKPLDLSRLLALLKTHLRRNLQ